MQPLVTVITPAYNSARFIHRAIESVKRQSISLEHIIVDDCSEDGTWDILQSQSQIYPWLKIVRLNKNSGPVFARNTAIEIATGRYLAFLDIDDFWLPNKLEIQIRFMIHNNCAMSYTDYRFVSENGSKIGPRLKGFDKIGWNLHHMTRYLGCLTIIIDQHKIPSFKFPNLNSSIRAEDFLAWSCCIRQIGHVLRCPFDLARYSVVFNSRSALSYRSLISIWHIYVKIEKINICIAFFYFICYFLTVTWKRVLYKPRYDRAKVDKDFLWSIIGFKI